MSAYRGGTRPPGIAFRDFRPAMLDAGGLVASPTFEPLETAIEAANAWIRKSGVAVINVETVLVPNLTLLTDTTTAEAPMFRVNQEAFWYQVVRVWYEAG